MHELLSIGQFADAVGLSVSAVRFYADRGVLPPAEVDADTGYRSFSTSQIAAGCLVRDLRLIGLPLAQVEQALEQREAEIRQLVDEHIAQLEDALGEARLTASHLGQSLSNNHSPESDKVVVRAAEFFEALHQVLPFAATDPGHPHLMSVLLEATSGSLRIAATDTHRLAVRDLAAIHARTNLVAVISAAAAQRWLSEAPKGEQASLHIADSAVQVAIGNSLLRAPIVPAEFPDYERFLSRDRSRSVVLCDSQREFGLPGRQRSRQRSQVRQRARSSTRPTDWKVRPKPSAQIWRSSSSRTR